MTALLAVGIFVVTYTFIATERVPRVTAALGGVAAMAVVGVVAAPRSLLVAGATSAAGALLSRWRKRRQENSWRDR